MADIVIGAGRMREAWDQLQRVAAVDSTVLLSGESGTGKELAAHVLHDGNPRRAAGPLVCVQCGGVPETLLESELFGHVRGAFTGAEQDRIGRFEQADGGTLFLDEISTMSLDAQIRLLRVLQDRRVTPLGSAESRDVDVRVVVATNEDLKKLTEEGTFRLDLYYRVSTYPVHLPPLRERPADLLPLVEHFAERVAERLGLPGLKRFSPDAIRAMSIYDWPGNVRELENAVEYASIRSEGREVVEPHDLPPHLVGMDVASGLGRAAPVLTEEGLSFRTTVTDLERDLILQSLRLTEGNKARAAQLLELKRTTFLEKLRRLEQNRALS